MVSVPVEFMPLLEAELNERGYFSYPQLMDHILSDYFKERPAKPEPAVKATVSEVEERR